jgi:hypothetical protein
MVSGTPILETRRAVRSWSNEFPPDRAKPYNALS